MSNFAQLTPRKGHGFTGLPRGANASAGDVGSITYARAVPNANYLPANGQSILVADYPLYYQLASRVPSFYTRRATGPASGAPGAAAGSDNIALSPSGTYFATRYDPVTADAIYLYKIDGGVITALTTKGMTGIARVGLTMVFTDGDRHVVSFTDAAPYLHVFARTAGTDTFGSLLTGSPAGVSAVVNAIVVTPDDVIIGAIATTPFLNASQISGSTVVTKSTGIPTLHATPAKIVRTKDGSRYAMAFATAPYLRVFDYAAGAFAEISGSVPNVNPPTDLAISPAGDWIAIVQSDGNTQVLKASGANAYATANINRVGSQPAIRARFTQDGIYLVLSNTNSGSPLVLEIANGAFLEASRGVFPGLGSLAQMVFAQNADAMATTDIVTPWFRIFGADAAPISVPLPACPIQGSGANTLYPFVKVK